MRHVDDAHQAEGDGQSECGEQKDAGQAQPRKDQAHHVGAALRGLDALDRAAQGREDLRVLLEREPLRELPLGVRLA